MPRRKDSIIPLLVVLCWVSTLFFSPSDLFSPARQSKHELLEGEQAARDFSYNEIKIGTHAVFFRGRFPDAKLSDHPVYLNRQSSVLRPSPTRKIIVEFYRNQVFNLTAVVAVEELQNIGGAPVFKEKLIEKFGPPHKSKPNGDCRWIYPGSKLHVLYTASDELVVVAVTDLTHYHRITAGKRRLPIGAKKNSAKRSSEIAAST